MTIIGDDLLHNLRMTVGKRKKVRRHYSENRVIRVDDGSCWTVYHNFPFNHPGLTAEHFGASKIANHELADDFRLIISVGRPSAVNYQYWNQEDRNYREHHRKGLEDVKVSIYSVS